MSEQSPAELADYFNTGFESPFVEYLGLRFTSVTDDRIEAVWPAGKPLHQPFGVVHGGAHCGVVETMASLGASYWIGQREPGAHAVGVNNNTDFYRSVSEGELRSVCTPLHRGRSQQVWLVETFDVEDRMVARGQVRLQNITAKR